MKLESAAMEDEREDGEEFEYSRNYFLAKELGGSGRKKKSAGKISDINVVDEKDLRSALSELRPKSEPEIEALLRSYKDRYSKWLFELRCGFGLLMYGFGSKKALLEDFASSALTDYDVIVINGYLPSINLKQVMITIAELLHDKQSCRRRASRQNKRQFSTLSTEDLLMFLNEEVPPEKDSFLCLVVHNIDGQGLRDSDSQQLLARIAGCFNIRVIASIDHVNAPLLWDKRMAHVQFNWWWHHAPTYAPYAAEGALYPPILTSGTSAQCARTAAIVLRSLTPNAQSVFKILAEYQLENEKEEGMPASALYIKCRERFLVSSQAALNSHLTEFKDHGLVKTKKHSDGQDCIHVPLSSEAMRKLLSDLATEF